MLKNYNEFILCELCRFNTLDTVEMEKHLINEHQSIGFIGALLLLGAKMLSLYDVKTLKRLKG